MKERERESQGKRRGKKIDIRSLRGTSTCVLGLELKLLLDFNRKSSRILLFFLLRARIKERKILPRKNSDRNSDIVERYLKIQIYKTGSRTRSFKGYVLPFKRHTSSGCAVFTSWTTPIEPSSSHRPGFG